MHRQVGDLAISPDGLATRGLLLRHLALPGGLEDTRAILEWIATELGPATYVNLMGQYRPSGRVSPTRYPELARPIHSDELAAAFGIAEALGLARLDRARRHRNPPHAMAGR
jgi:putative pyruvate formate lyase activating enzyme